MELFHKAYYALFSLILNSICHAPQQNNTIS